MVTWGSQFLKTSNYTLWKQQWKNLFTWAMFNSYVGIPEYASLSVSIPILIIDIPADLLVHITPLYPHYILIIISYPHYIPINMDIPLI